MSARDHSSIEQLLAVQALGGLEPGERVTLQAAMDEHGPDCAECRGLQAEFEGTAGLLGFALDPVPVDPEVVDRVLAHPRGPRVIISPERRPRRRWAATLRGRRR